MWGKHPPFDPANSPDYAIFWAKDDPAQYGYDPGDRVWANEFVTIYKRGPNTARLDRDRARHEPYLRELLRRLLNPGIYAGALITAPAGCSCLPGSARLRHTDWHADRRHILQGFNAGEKMAEGGGTFRWTGADSYIVLQDVGRQDFDVTLTLSGNRPPGQPPATLRIESGTTVLLDTQPGPDLIDYKLAVTRDDVRTAP